MKQQTIQKPKVNSLDDLAKKLDYSLLKNLSKDPDASTDGVDYWPRQVFSGHYVPVKPEAISQPEYVAHSSQLFSELGFADDFAHSSAFMHLFTGDLSKLPTPFVRQGWACGYALSIYGVAYQQQCPFQTGNGYGDGRAVSILEMLHQGQRFEMQLKGGGRTPYCRGGDGRAVLRSSVREFLAQEAMHALGVPTSRSLCLFVSKTEQVKRPWYLPGSKAVNPDAMVSEPVAISTRVASSFIRVGQLELFARRSVANSHPDAEAELKQLVKHLIAREYAKDVDINKDFASQLLMLAKAFRQRLANLVAEWLRVGYCQGNFNSDNCAAGGFTLDYGPFGFCEQYQAFYQPWTGGGQHFAFLNQPKAAERNFFSFCQALAPLLKANPEALQQLQEIAQGFAAVMQQALESMWAQKLGLQQFNAVLWQKLESLMHQTPVDYNRFFRALSAVPDNVGPLKVSFYPCENGQPLSGELELQWQKWLSLWRCEVIKEAGGGSPEVLAQVSQNMQAVNPKYVLREWLLAKAYQQAAQGNYTFLRQLQTVMSKPYDEQSPSIAEEFDRQKPAQAFGVGGLSHMSCSS